MEGKKMSAYIVEKTTLYRVIKTLCKINDYNLKLKSIKSEAMSDPKKLFKKLNRLNRYSVSQRYEDQIFNNKDSYQFDLNEYQNEILKDDKFQNLKSLRCFLYQSCEGDTKKKDLYKTLNEAADSLVYSIVYNLKDYDQAEWR
jgi:hypothetical protein